MIASRLFFMMRPTVLLPVLVLATASAVAGTCAAVSPPRLLDPSRWSLGGESLDTGDPWDAARLLARFGEVSAAEGALSRAAPRGDGCGELLRARFLTEQGRYESADSLLALRANVWDGRERFLHYLWRARLNVAIGRYEKALELAARAAETPDTLFEAYADLVSCDALLGMGDAPGAGERAKKRLSRDHPAALAIEFETRLVDAFLGGGRTKDAVAFLDSLRKTVPRRTARAPLFAREVEARLTDGDAAGAVGAAVELVKAFDTAATTGAVDSVLARVPAESLSNEALLEFGDFLLRRGRAPDAERLLAVISPRALEEPQGEKRRLLSGELLFAQRRYAAARRELRPPFSDPRSERRAALLRARIYRASGERLAAAGAYEEFARAFPQDAKAPEALYVAWEIQHEAGKGAKAAELLDRIAAAYPGHRYARLATMAIVRDHVERKQYARAVRMLGDALDRRGREDPAFLYYLADIYGKMGRADKRAELIEELSALDPASFYLDAEISSPTAPVLAAFAEGAADSSALAGALDFLKSVVEKREAAYERVRGVLGADDGGTDPSGAADAISRGRALVEMGLRGWADAEFREAESARARPPREDLALARAYEEAGMPWRNVRAILRVYYSMEKEERRPVEADLRFLARPVPYPLLVLASCRRAGVAAHLVYAMMREESRFDERAVSPAGAVGLMQIMPATGEELAEELGLSEAYRGRLLSPEVNISLGVSHAARLLERWGGDPLKMLAAYNAGSTNAARWFNDRTASKPRVEQVDGIGFWETREYVKRIVESARLYEAFYFEPSPGPSQDPPAQAPLQWNQRSRP